VGAYVALRGMALNWQFAGSSMNDPLNNPFLKMGTTEWEPYSAGDKIATIGFILLKYLRLLVWPHPLTHDYYPFTIARQTLSAPLALTGLGVYAGLLLWAVWGLMKKWRLAFGLLLFLLPLLLVSNLLFPVGTFMAERFLFMPSAGFSLVFAAVLFGAFRRVRLPNWAPLGAAGLAAVALAALTLLRNPAWKSNQSLMEADLKASANSAKLNHSYGTLMLDQALVAVDTARRSQLLRKSEEHLRKALSLHASYYDAALAYGACAFYLGDFDRSVMAYQGAYRVNPADPKSKTGLLYALRYGGQYFAGPGQDSARAVVYFTQAWDIQPDTALAAGLARHFSRYNQPQEAIAWLERGLALAPGDPGLTRALGAAYRSAGMPEKAANLGKQPSSFLIVPPSGGK
ncbi:MAG: tetratricopeptide repeat protein, partial [Saprospiraceae bacterium]|nr:tetratricopeptide repeat protein [Saprospiraceae bacterium]